MGLNKLDPGTLNKLELNLISGLKVYELDDEKNSTGKIAYDKMPWREVVSMASQKGLFKPGMGKEAVLKALIENEQGA